MGANETDSNLHRHDDDPRAASSIDLQGLFYGIPAKYQTQMALVQGELHLSKTLTDDPACLNFLSELAMKMEKSGFCSRIIYHEPAEFEKVYSKHSAVAFIDSKNDSQFESLLKDLIKQAFEQKASDIHVLEAGNLTSVKMRVKGLLSNYEQYPPEVGERLTKVAFDSLGTATGRAQYTKRERSDGRIIQRAALPPDVFAVRLHAEPIQSNSDRDGGLGTFFNMRLLYDMTDAHGTLEQRLESLGFTYGQRETIRRLTQRRGMSIIAGPTGSGKSTVLKHIMESMVAEAPDKSYFSVEDPPEYQMRGIAQIRVETNSSNDDDKAPSWDERAHAYTDAIAGAMRSDPDVIMIGEIRYPEAAVAAIDAALTGHSVWATLHASDAFGIITRLESLLRSARVNDPLDAICDSNALSGLCNQRLIALLCPECKRRWVDLPEDERRRSISDDLYMRLVGMADRFDHKKDMEKVFVRGNTQCEFCKNSGLHNMTVAAETVELTNDILSELRQGNKLKARQIWMEQHKGLSFVDHAVELIKKGMMDPTIAESRLGETLTYSQHYRSSESFNAQSMYS
jgi:type II secretory ATPase GspE/PulE/Tfp pilus assembly ATPase PilB-like protein